MKTTTHASCGQFSRRRFLATTSTLAAASLLGSPQTAAAEPPPETTRIRLSKIRGICVAPQYIAEPLLRTEGFTDVRYVAMDASAAHAKALASGEVDASVNYAALLVTSLDAGEPIVVLAGVHVGCFELFGNDRVHTLRDLKGKSIGLEALGSTPHLFLASMAAYVGLDARKDMIWVTQPSVRPKALFEQGKIDAFLGFPPEPQELRSRGIGRVVVNSSLDRPWSQYFCISAAHSRRTENSSSATRRRRSDSYGPS